MAFYKKGIANWKLVHARHKARQIQDNDRENQSCNNYKYEVEDKVRIITGKEKES